MGKQILTVSRQFGSGGRTIGRAVAERLGIPCYDKELIEQVAQKTGFDPNYIAEHGEYAPGKSIFSYAINRQASDALGGMSTPEYLWVQQRQIILDLAQKGPCVIVGRCADDILSERTDCLHVFVYADAAFRADRIVKLYGERDASPQERLKDKDGRRRINYKHFTGREWGQCQNYDLCLNSGVLGVDTCTDLLVRLMQGE